MFNVYKYCENQKCMIYIFQKKTTFNYNFFWSYKTLNFDHNLIFSCIKSYSKLKDGKNELNR